MAQDWLSTPIDLTGKRIFVAGHNGMVGRAVSKALKSEGAALITAPRRELDLRDQAATYQFMQTHKPDMVVLAAAKVGGILANINEPATFLSDNILIASNVIEATHASDVQRLLNLGSSCMYPKDAPQPLKPEYLLTGSFEPTNEFYALAKVAAMKLCESYAAQHGRDYMTAIPCNLYGPHDKFDAQRSHVIPALMLKMHEAKNADAPSLTLLGTGAPLREFLYADDLAAALIAMLKNYGGRGPVNIGSATEISFRDLADIIKRIVGYGGEILWDETGPDGMARKVMDSSLIGQAQWAVTTDLQNGLTKTYQWFCNEYDAHKKAA